VLLPNECIELNELSKSLQAEVDTKFNSLSAAFRNREVYRRHLWRSGVRTEAQQEWLRWENIQNTRIAKAKRRMQTIRDNYYQTVARDLRRRYNSMAIDVVGKSVQRLQTDLMIGAEVRQRRNMVAAYKFKQILVSKGIRDLGASSKDSTRECTSCGQMHEVGIELMQRCPVTGYDYDQDVNAAAVMLHRAQQVLQTEKSK
jgi:transposase